jgi:hypothetical protein
VAEVYVSNGANVTFETEKKTRSKRFETPHLLWRQHATQCAQFCGHRGTIERCQAVSCGCAATPGTSSGVVDGLNLAAPVVILVTESPQTGHAIIPSGNKHSSAGENIDAINFHIFAISVKLLLHYSYVWQDELSIIEIWAFEVPVGVAPAKQALGDSVSADSSTTAAAAAAYSDGGYRNG